MSILDYVTSYLHKYGSCLSPSVVICSCKVAIARERGVSAGLVGNHELRYHERTILHLKGYTDHTHGTVIGS